MIKRKISLILILATLVSSFVGCGEMGKDGESTNGPDGSTDGKKTVLHVAALEAAYGKDVWEEICEDFEEVYEGVEVKLTISKNLEDVIGSKMKAGDFPDVVYLGTGRPAGLTETMIKDSAILPLENFKEINIIAWF